MSNVFKTTMLIAFAVLMAACTTTPLPPKDYGEFRQSDPRSILVVPVINHSTEVEAPNLFLTTLPIPLSNKGFYVFPVNMVKSVLESDGLSDPYLVHSSSTQELATLFSADSVLYVEITEWRSQYVLTSSNIVVGFLYTLKDGKTGELLWQEQKRHVHQMQATTGSLLADLVATAIVSAANSARADYSAVAVTANAVALNPLGQGLPAGPYAPTYNQDLEAYPVTGNGNVSNAELSAVAYPVVGKALAQQQEEEAGKTAEDAK